MYSRRKAHWELLIEIIVHRSIVYERNSFIYLFSQPVSEKNMYVETFITVRSLLLKLPFMFDREEERERERERISTWHIKRKKHCLDSESDSDRIQRDSMIERIELKVFLSNPKSSLHTMTRQKPVSLFVHQINLSRTAFWTTQRSIIHQD